MHLSPSRILPIVVLAAQLQVACSENETPPHSVDTPDAMTERDLVDTDLEDPVPTNLEDTLEGTNTPTPKVYATNWEPGDPLSNGLFMDVLKEPENQLTVQVWATGLVDVFGLAFHLRYNPKILQYLEGTTYPILDGGAETKESRRLIRHDPGFIRFGTVRVHEMGGYGQGANLSGIDLDKVLVAEFRYQMLQPGDSGVHIPIEGRDHRTSELEQPVLPVSNGTLLVEEIQP